MKVLSLLLLTSGLLLFGSVLVPIAAPTIATLTTPQLIDPSVDNPNPHLYVVNVLGISTADYSTPQTWFNYSASASAAPVSKVAYFSVSLPSIGLENVPVEINGEDLKKNAIHFSTSALPGAFGNSVVFGHSSLPQFYSKDNPLTIFNPLLKVKVGDEVLVNYDGITYKYIIKDTAEVTPDEISVLSQRYDRRELTLITCTPLGTYWKRFVVRAELAN